jgi:hypothetical protein
LTAVEAKRKAATRPYSSAMMLVGEPSVVFLSGRCHLSMAPLAANPMALPAIVEWVPNDDGGALRERCCPANFVIAALSKRD